MKIDFKYIFKKLWIELLTVLFISATLVVACLFTKYTVKTQGTNCPACGEQCIVFYKRTDTGEIIGCDYCVTKGNIYDEENKTN